VFILGKFFFREASAHSAAVMKLIRLPLKWTGMLLVCASLLGFPDLSVSAPAREPVRSLLEIRQDRVVVQRWDLSCGAAALATVLTYQHDDSVAEKKIAEAMLRRTDPLRVKVRGGFSLLDLKRYVESRGYQGRGYGNLTLQDLIDFGPTIVPVNFNGYNHFVVFRGLQGDRLLFADPAFGNRVVTVKEFEEAWIQNLGFVVARGDGVNPPGGLAPRPHDFPNLPGAAIRSAIR
jgi:hypothetical protein